MIKRKDGRWQEQVKLPGMSKPKYFYGKTQKEVRRKMAEWSQAEEEAKTKAVLFETVADEWEKWHTDRVGYGTAQNIKPALEEAKAWFSGRNVGDIYADEITEFLEEVAGRGYSKRTVQARKSVLNMIYRYAIGRRITKNNPTQAAELPTGLSSTKREPPTAEQMEHIREGFCKPFGLFPMLQLYTGMRRGELLALEWEDIDQERNVIKVNKAIEFINSTPHLKSTKTDAGEREIILLDELKQMLPNPGKGLVFPGKDGGYMHGYEYRYQWANWCASVGLAVERKDSGKRGADRYEVLVTSHQLRHYYATLLYEAGVGVKDAQTLLGHSNVQTTLNVYTHISKRQKDTTADRLNKFLCQTSVEGAKKL